MPHRVPLPKRRTARKLLLASLCLVAAATWTAFRPATVQASDCSDVCEYACASIGSWCGGIWHSESGCDWWCADD